MKLEHLVGDRFKERPADCQVDSHALMVRGGYIKYVANGIYSSYPPLKRVLKKLDDLRGSEAHFSVILSEEDEKLYKRLGIHVSCEPKYEVKKLYHK